MSEKVLETYFDRERDTLNTVRFQERIYAERPLRIGVLYLKKSAYAELGSPETLRLTIEDGDNDRD